MSEVFIGRQPILDQSMKVFAYELEFHQGLNPNQATVAATEQLLQKTEEEIGFQSIVGKHSALMQLPRELIAHAKLPAFDSNHRIVLEIPNDVTHDIEILKSLKALKQEGSSIALDNFTDDESSQKLAAISDFVKIDNEACSEVKMKSMLKSLHEKGVKVIAEKVETEEMFNYLKKMGFDYFQGYFFTNPVIMNGHKLSGNKLTLLQLVSKINDPNTGFEELSKILSHDVALSHKLLVAVNNPAAMIPIKVETIADALKYMGLKRLKFWVNMMMLSDLEDTPKELLTTSLVRARFCEKLAEKSGHGRDKDSFFLVGLFSNLGAFFRAPIGSIVEEMPLSDDIKIALVEKKGPMGEALKCLQKLESTDASSIDLCYETVGISDIAEIFMSASAWAQQATDNL